MKGGIFSKPLFKSKVKSVNVKLPELIFGYFLGPTLALLVSGIFVNGFLNVYYTDYLFKNLLAEGSEWENTINTFMTLLPMFSAILIVLGNLLAGQLIERTNTPAGKARPWILLSAILMPVASILIFAIPLFFKPESNPVLTMVITAIGYNLFFAAAYPVYYTANSSLVPVSTRNGKQRGLLASASNMSVTAGVGLGGMVFPILRDLLINNAGTLEAQRGMWLLVFAIVGVVCLFAVVLQYMFTRERVNEEKLSAEDVEVVEEKKASIGQQFKAVAKDKFWWIVLVFCFLFQFAGTMKNFSLAYYVYNFADSKLVQNLGGVGSAQSMITILGSVPMTLAVAIVWPLSNKFGKRVVVIAGLITNVVGNVICQLGGNNLIVVGVGVFFKYLGAAPGCYMMLAMISDALDHAEARNGFRCDGLTMSIYASIMIAASPLVQGLFNAITASGANQTMSNFCYIWVEGILYAVLAVMMLFFTVEKFSKQDHEQILARQKAEAEAAGEVWIAPEERLRLEQEEADRIAEEAKLAELKARCAKKGLNYETEVAKLREKEAKKNKKK